MTIQRKMLSEEGIKKLKTWAFAHRSNVNINYAFLTEDEQGVYTLHPRPNQPCIGGELRKYSVTHPQDCTRPQDHRPSDLHHPFPKTGRPAGIVHIFHIQPTEQNYIHTLYSENSPWLRGFGGPEFVEFLKEENSPRYYGILLKTGDIDPTVLINLLKFVQDRQVKSIRFNEALEFGCSISEALIYIMFLQNAYAYTMNNQTKMLQVTPTSNYFFSLHSSIKRILDSDPRDLTGGLWSDRWDYNRPEMATVFTDEGNSPIIPVIQTLTQRLNVKFKEDNAIPLFKTAVEIMQDIIRESQEIQTTSPTVPTIGE